MSNVVIELQDVKKIYKMEGVETPALRGVDLKITKGQFIAIMGPSGSGKSTLLHMIGALDKPTSGKILLDGVDISTLKESDLARLRGKKIGIVFQFFNLHPTLTALENIELPMIIVEQDKKARQQKARELLHAVGLDHRANHLPSHVGRGAAAYRNSPRTCKRPGHHPR
jgi:putative ABC transport system ATP-binding protein